MAIVFKNNASTTLSAALSSSATSITVADATKLPSITGDEYFFCTIDDGSNIEIVKVTGVSSNTLTIVRAQDNTTAQTFSSGDIIEQRLTAAVLETFPQLDANEITATEFIGDLRGAVIFNAQAGEAIDKGEVVYVSGISGNTPIVALADADDSSKMPAFGLALESATLNSSLAIVTFGTISGVDTDTPGFSLGDTLYVSTTPGALTNSPPAGESSLLQNIGKVQRVHVSSGSIKVGGAGRTNAVPNLNDGNIFIGNASNQATTSTLDTSIVPENTNLYYTDARVQAVSINNVVEDTTPQLGGDLDLNSSDITGTGDINISGDITISDGSPILLIKDTDGTNTLTKITNVNGNSYIGARNDTSDGILLFGGYGGNTFTEFARWATNGNLTQKFNLTVEGSSTFEGNINLGDNDKAIFGAGSDLQIYHDGSNSFINDNGTGDLFIQASNNHYLRFINGDYAITTAENAGVGLRYDNSVKLATTSTGVDITGTLTVDNTINVNDADGYGNIELGGASGGFVDFKTPFSDDYDARMFYGGSNFQIRTNADQPILLQHNNATKLKTSSSGIEITGNATFEDNGKAIFGADSDLQIYHNGSNSFIDEVGTGRLYIRAADNLTFSNTDTTKTYANFENGGAAKLYHNSALSILTTTAGAEVREALTIGSSNNDLGTTAGDQLTPLTLRSDTSNGDFLLFTTERLSTGTTWTSAAHRIQRKVDATKMGYMQFGSNSADLITFGENASEYVRIDGAGQLGVGASPLAKFHVNKDGTGQIIALFSSDLGTNNRNMGILSPASDSTTAPFEFSTSNSFQFTIDAVAALNIAYDRKIGIGTTSPDTIMEIVGADPILTIRDTDTGQATANARIRFAESAGGDTLDNYWDVGLEPTQSLTFSKNGTEYARFNTNGNLGLGTDSPNREIDLTADNPRFQFTDSGLSNCKAEISGNSGHLALQADVGNSQGGSRITFDVDGAEVGRFTTTGLGIGTQTADLLSITFDGNISSDYTAFDVDIGKAGGSAITNLKGINVDLASADLTSGDEITNLYGAYINNSTTGGAAGVITNWWGIYVPAADANRTDNPVSAYFGDSVGIGVAAPTATLDVDGTIKLDGNYPTGTDNVALGNTALDSLTSGTYNTAIGSNALTANTTGGYNTALGVSALRDNVAGANLTGLGYGALVLNTASNNTAVGYKSLHVTTSGENNVAVGSNALLNNSTAGNNTAVGFNSMFSTTTGGSNTAVGGNALDANTTGSNNTAIGRYALTDNTTGIYNTAVGWIALGNNTTGNSSTAVGMYSLRASTGGGENTALGYKASYLNTTGLYNVAVGVNALLANTTANRGTAVGHSALSNNTTGAENTAVGFYALLNNGTGNRNVAVGDGALDANTTASDNTAMGQGALGGNTTGTRNTAMGQLAANDNTTGEDIVAMGQNALALNTTGSNNTAIGRAALEKNTTANNNTAVGYHALLDNVTGTQNTAVGGLSLANNTATGNSAFGFYAARFNTTGVENTAIGRYSLYNNTTGSYNTAIGNLAQQNNSVTDCIAIGAEAMRYNSGNRNIAIGNEANLQGDGDDNIIIGDLAADSSTFTGSDNIMIGSNAGTRLGSGGTNTCIGHNVALYLTTGDYNTGIGSLSLLDVTTGERNTALGSFSGQNISTGVYNTAIGYNSSATTTTGSNNTTLGYDSRTSGANAQGQIAIGSSVYGTANNRVHIGNSSSHIYANYNTNATWTHSSDERAKKDITPSDLGLDFVNDLKPVTYKFKAPSEYPTEWQSYDANKTKAFDKKTHHGMIAQDIKKALDKSGVNDFEGWDVLPDGKQQISESMFVFPLIKAVQELSSQVDELKQEIKILKGE